MQRCFGIAFLLVLSFSAANALDLNDLAPCKPAAMRFCDRGAGANTANLLRCGARLAAVSHQVGNGCREVLRRYGQLNDHQMPRDFGSMNASLR